METRLLFSPSPSYWFFVCPLSLVFIYFFCCLLDVLFFRPSPPPPPPPYFFGINDGDDFDSGVVVGIWSKSRPLFPTFPCTLHLFLFSSTSHSLSHSAVCEFQFYYFHFSFCCIFNTLKILFILSVSIVMIIDLI